MKTKIYHVTGMTCDGCVRAVTRAIQGADLQATIVVDLASGEITVDSHLNDDAIAAAVDGAGFTFDSRTG